MNFGELFWLALLGAAFYPLIKQKALEYGRKSLLAELEQKRNSRVIMLVHRQETMAILGFPIYRYIDINDAEEVLRAIHLTDPQIPIDFILHTPGGLVLPSLQIARALSKHPGKVTVFVPHYAMSGGTLLALAADEIVMNEFAVLGPVDPVIWQFPAVSLLKAVAKKPPDEVDDHILIMADQAEKAVAEIRNFVRELLVKHQSAAKADELARLLAEGTWTHDYPITFEAARDLGLPVSTAMPKEILRLMNLFPQPLRKTPTVEYLPTSRRQK
ncbi:MAG: ATP-dependent Clp protease proteolytic subunit [Deltaproteobacteria bacterium]|nr:ATP-dependent Clp protease proteolytic subunit [Deltaproteobacteria bacterium]